MIPHKYLAIAVAVGLLVLGAKLYITSVERAAYERGRGELQAEYDAKSLALALSYAERIKIAQEERDANQTIIDNLRADVSRVRIHYPKCPAAATGENSDGAARVFSANLERAFENLQRGTTELIGRCDALNLDAIEANASR